MTTRKVEWQTYLIHRFTKEEITNKEHEKIMATVPLFEDDLTEYDHAMWVWLYHFLIK